MFNSSHFLSLHSDFVIWVKIHLHHVFWRLCNVYKALIIAVIVKFIFSPGGKGCNQALAASYADAQVHFITKIGTDQFSDYAVNFISSSRIKTSTIYQTENHQTGTASIFVSEESGENIISIYPGSNMDITADEVKIQKDRVINSNVILLQLETNIDALKENVSASSVWKTQLFE